MKLIDFPVPKGLVPPEGKDEWQQMATFRLKPTGNKMCIVAIGDVKLPGYDDKNYEPPKDMAAEAGANTAGRYREAMAGKEGGAYSSGGSAY